MRLSTAVKIIALAHIYFCYVLSVLCKKESMRDAITSTTVEDSKNNERILQEFSSSSSDNDYTYRRNYVAVIEPENFVSLSPDGGSIVERIFGGAGPGIPQLQGSTTILNGKLYDPADIAIVNKLNGVELNDVPNGFSVPEHFIGLPFAGGRQPKQPIPPGDSAFFYHGECVATSAINGKLPNILNRRRLDCIGRKLQEGEGGSGGYYGGSSGYGKGTGKGSYGSYGGKGGKGSKSGGYDSKSRKGSRRLQDGYYGGSSGYGKGTGKGSYVTSHSCKLNICLGAGGFNCIAFYSGTSFVFDVGQQITSDNIGGCEHPEPSVPPPFPSTIIGGTGSFEGIEGTVDIATICGSTGPIIENNDRRRLVSTGPVKIGFIVQTISVNANMPLPVAP